jgi:hypothetical protein
MLVAAPNSWVSELMRVDIPGEQFGHCFVFLVMTKAGEVVSFPPVQDRT